MRGLPDDPHTGSPRDVLARIEAERRGTPFLIYRDEEEQQHLVDLEPAPERVSVGRHPGCDVPLHWDREASRLHA
ncbi:MAG TPA: hypothetical protein VNO82_04820, partial [Solirubrobacteraceae bacterium]|nr:hypothetical protein [Solirubrobacteraceae bacterium]